MSTNFAIPKSSTFGTSSLCEKDVVGLQVAVNQLTVVRRIDRVTDAAHHVQGASWREPTVAAQHLAHGRTDQQLHHQISAGVVRDTEIVHRHDVRVREARRDERLATESVGGIRTDRPGRLESP